MIMTTVCQLRQTDYEAANQSTEHLKYPGKIKSRDSLFNINLNFGPTPQVEVQLWSLRQTDDFSEQQYTVWRLFMTLGSLQTNTAHTEANRGEFSEGGISYVQKGVGYSVYKGDPYYNE